MREEGTAEAGDQASCGFWRSPPVCIQQRVGSICCAQGLVGRVKMGSRDRSEVTVQAWPSCSLLHGDMDASWPMAQASHTAVQVLGKEELGRKLGHVGRSQGRGCLWLQVWVLSLLAPVPGERGQWKRLGFAVWVPWPLWGFSDLEETGWTHGGKGCWGKLAARCGPEVTKRQQLQGAPLHGQVLNSA